MSDLSWKEKKNIKILWRTFVPFLWVYNELWLHLSSAGKELSIFRNPFSFYFLPLFYIHKFTCEKSNYDCGKRSFKCIFYQKWNKKVIYWKTASTVLYIQHLQSFNHAKWRWVETSIKLNLMWTMNYFYKKLWWCWKLS